jgi:hypothetical protein
MRLADLTGTIAAASATNATPIAGGRRVMVTPALVLFAY